MLQGTGSALVGSWKYIKIVNLCGCCSINDSLKFIQKKDGAIPDTSVMLSAFDFFSLNSPETINT